MTVREKNFSLTDVYGADEAFVTGTFAGLVPVRQVDGRVIGDGSRPVTERLRGLYLDAVAADVAAQGGRCLRHRGPRAAGRLVRPAQHLHRADALVGEPARHRGGRRAALRALPHGHRPGPPRPRRGGRSGETDWRSVVSELTGPLPTASAWVPEAHGAPPRGRDRRPHLGPRPDQRPADPRPGGGGGLVHPGARGRHARRTSACCSRCGCTRSSQGPARRPWWSTPPTSSTSRRRSCASCAGARASASAAGCCAGRPAPVASDGVWAPHWYAAVERSTGFERRDRDPVALHGTAAEVAQACRPAYEHLHAQRWTP